MMNIDEPSNTCNIIFFTSSIYIILNRKQIRTTSNLGSFLFSPKKVAFADRIILNKCDLVDEPHLDEVERRIRMINEAVKIKRTTKAKVDMDFIMGTWGEFFGDFFFFFFKKIVVKMIQGDT